MRLNFMKKLNKRGKILFWCSCAVVLAAAVLLAVFLVFKINDIPILSTKTYDYNFENFFEKAQNNGDSMAAVTVTKVKTVNDVIEKWNDETVDVTTYTRITAKVDIDFSGDIESDTVQIYLLGDASNFPDREIIQKGRSYVFRLESWVHENGVVWLLPTFDSTFLRIYDGKLITLMNAADRVYYPIVTADEFAKLYAAYKLENPVTSEELSAHYDTIEKALGDYNYKNEALSYQLSDSKIKRRRQVLQKLREALA